MVRVQDCDGFNLGAAGGDAMKAKFGAIGEVGGYALAWAPDRMRTIMQGIGRSCRSRCLASIRQRMLPCPWASAR